ncbi:MAG: RNA polymerase sigma factor [Gammaproteobacteria bacterium]|nr:RNA polymerase sigma factor [Gammaproteobacteria bacterium]
MPAVALPGAVPDAQRREEALLQQRSAMERFLADVERRAFRIARLAVGDRDDALDIVQDAMLRLVRHYATAPENEWPMLFFRILRNRILDHQRRGSVRRRVLAFFGAPADPDDDACDPVAASPAPAADGPELRTTLGDAMSALETAVAALPARQQEAFLLRNLEGLDVAATAAVMGCSEGSVKTHYSRAVHSLRATLGEHWP